MYKSYLIIINNPNISIPYNHCYDKIVPTVRVEHAIGDLQAHLSLRERRALKHLLD